MTASGYGDLLGKVTAGADWLVADALGVEAVDPSLVAGAGPAAGGRRAAGRAGRRRPGGHGRPHRGAGHVRAGHAGPHLVPARLRGRAPVQPPVGDGGAGPRPAPAPVPRVQGRGRHGRGGRPLRAAPRPRPGRRGRRGRPRRLAQPRAGGGGGGGHPHHPGLAAAAVTESLAKHVDADRLARRLALLRDRWPALRDRLAQLLPAARLAGMLAAAGCPTGPSELGLDRAAFKATYGGRA